jgi:hypothetical protein
MLDTEFVDVVVVGAEVDEEGNYASGVCIRAESEGGVEITYIRVVIYLDKNDNGQCDPGEEQKSDEYTNPNGTTIVQFGGAEFHYNRQEDGPIKYEVEVKDNTGAQHKTKGILKK